MQYVDTLSEQLADLRANKTKRVQPEVIAAYEEHVREIRLQLLPAALPSFAASRSSKAATASGNQLGSGSLPESDPHPAPSPPSEEQHREQLMDGAQLRQRPGHAAADHLSRDAQRRLQTEEHLQEDLTDDMAGLAASLKRNVMAINSAVKDREGLLRDTEELMEHNQQAASWNVTVSKHVKRRNAVGLCMVIGVLMMVCGVSVAVYMQIKITSFLGYKASKNT